MVAGVHASDPGDLHVVEAIELLRRRVLSSRELTDACLARIRERDGARSPDGDPASINAWVRVYEDDARAAASRARMSGLRAATRRRSAAFRSV